MTVSSQSREISVGPGYVFSEVASDKDIYKFESFREGFLVTKQKKKSQPMKLNFDYLENLPTFINEKGDTVFVNERLADMIYVGKAIFFWNSADKKYYELLMYHGDTKLAVEKSWKLARVETLYTDPRSGQTTKSISRDRGNTVYSPKLARTVRNENRVYRRDSSYVFIDARGETYKTTRANLMKLFPAQKVEIEKHLDKVDVNFRKEEELKALFQYCVSLYSK